MRENNFQNIDHKSRTTCYSSSADINESAMLFDNRIWVDSKEAADYLRISVGALRNAVYRRQIIARKFRRRLYFNLNELNRLLDNSIVR
ncbi:MAG: hypothetical protein CME66_09125 [Halobacteriovoraceae bacterium]|nr:hypothetical protein [Halobacteriovoraceae bacterium]